MLVGASQSINVLFILHSLALLPISYQALFNILSLAYKASLQEALQGLLLCQGFIGGLNGRRLFREGGTGREVGFAVAFVVLCGFN